jgi:site-specific DNA recombinase
MTAVATEQLDIAVSYLRVSTKEQAQRDGDPEGYSIPAQREANRRKASAIGAAVCIEFVDRGESARSADRPALKEMLTYLREHPEVRYVIVHKVDRLARNRGDDVEINLAIQQAKVTLVSATENIDETPSGMLLHGIMSTIAEFYSRNLANEVNKGMGQKAKSGGTPTRAPIGYRNVQRSGEFGTLVRTIDIDPVRADHIRWAFTAYATGEWTLLKMAAELEVRGLATVPTKSWPARPLRANYVQRVLTNPYYKGDITWHGVRYDGRHEALVDPTTWQIVQTVLEAHRTGEKQREHPHYLKSSVFCGACGSRLIVDRKKNRYGTVYAYFVCLGRHQKLTSCTRKAITIDKVEELIEEHYRTVELRPDIRRTLEQSLLAELHNSRVAAEVETKALSAQLATLSNERLKLLQAHYTGAVPLDLLKLEQDRIAKAIAVIEPRLAAVQSTFDVVERNLKTALDLASDCYRTYLNATDYQRRLFNQAFFEQIMVDEDDVRSELAEPFKMLIGHGGDVEEFTGHKKARQADDQAGDPLQSWGASFDGGSKQINLVRPAGFEPTTPWFEAKYSNPLSYGRKIMVCRILS